MITWTPLFSKIVDSSIWDEPDYVVKVFLTMLAKKDRDQVVRGSAYNIAQWSRKTEAEVLDALKILSSPDKRRLEPQPHEGRRVEKVEDGWLILNGEEYRKLLQSEAKKDRDRKAQAKWRERQASKTAPSGREQRFVAAYNNGDSAGADAIAAEGLSDIIPSEQHQEDEP